MTSDQFKHTIAPLHASLYRIAFHITGNHDDAMDALQETLIGLWRHNDQLARSASPQAYCITTLKNQCITLLRRRKISCDINEARYSPDESDIASQTEQRDRLRKVRLAITQLPPTQRRVITLSAFGQCSNSEIAVITGLSEQNIRAALSRARKKIKELFTP